MTKRGPFKDVVAVVRGAGELGTGVACRLHQAGIQVVMTELARPTCVCQPVSFAEAVAAGSKTLEGVTGRFVAAPEARRPRGGDDIAVMVDPAGAVIRELKPDVVVDAIMAKRNTGTALGQAALVVGLGPGFVAGQDVHAVVETKRGHHLGRVITSGTAEANTGVPELIDGQSVSRLLLAPRAGRLALERRIGDRVHAGEVVARVNEQPVVAGISGLVRGLLPQDYEVEAGAKIGDLDPSAELEYCYTVSDRALAVGSGVLAAILEFWPRISGVDPATGSRGRGRRPGHLPEDELLGPAEFALLGLLRQGSAHGYELARAFTPEAELGRIVHLRPGQLYAYLNKLETVGLISGPPRAIARAAPRERKVFSLTESGQRQFEAWLGRPVYRTRQLAVDFLAKLLFAGQLDPAARRALIEAQIESIEREAGELHGRDGEATPLQQAEVRLCEAHLSWLRQLACS
ncbi:MAG TPA: selenium-dependent molybdenum cofactor biosynthesis protein YqeB [Chloroflexota bacterium]|nr:selenium-dependent molybdenum cofactor biosynthesis protein YqeB [Chloroflexota bacterium]